MHVNAYQGISMHVNVYINGISRYINAVHCVPLLACFVVIRSQAALNIVQALLLSLKLLAAKAYSDI
jgi:hypothetical protein